MKPKTREFVERAVESVRKDVASLEAGIEALQGQISDRQKVIEELMNTMSLRKEELERAREAIADFEYDLAVKPPRW